MALNNREAMILKYGSEENYREFMREIGSIGGSARVKKGFATMSPRKRREMARKAAKSMHQRNN